MPERSEKLKQLQAAVQKHLDYEIARKKDELLWLDSIVLEGPVLVDQHVIEQRTQIILNSLEDLRSGSE